MRRFPPASPSHIALLAVLWLSASLAVGLPVHVEALFDRWHLALSAEVAALMLLAGLAGGGAGRRRIGAWREGRPGLVLIASGLCLIVLLRLADMAAQRTAGRPFEPSFDLALIPALWDVLTASIHPLTLGLGVMALLSAVAVASWLLVAATAQTIARPGAARVFAGLLAVAVAVQVGAVATGAGWRPFQPMDRGLLALLDDHAMRYANASDLRAASARALSHDPVADMPMDRRLSALAGRDVIVVWIESYGLAALKDPRHAPLLADRLAHSQAALDEAGFHSLSGLVDSPVLGGRSWLAHGTFRSGLSLREPPVQTMVLASGRRSLVHAFAEGGWQTVAVGPALDRPWPEGGLWGFDRVIRQPDLGYVGPAFGWSPMPDQFVLDRVEALDLRGAGRPVYLEIALTTSHAPWTPLPPWLTEGTSADGAEFARLAAPPDYTDMAGGYARSLDYSLRAAVDWLTRAVTDDALVILIGDHPAVPWIAGGTQDRTVPWHILSRDVGTLDRLAGWGLSAGLVPDVAAPVLPMRDILVRFLESFSPEAQPAS